MKFNLERKKVVDAQESLWEFTVPLKVILYIASVDPAYYRSLLYSPCITDWSFGIHSGHDPSKDDVAIEESETRAAIAVMPLPDDTGARQVEVDAARARFLARKQSKTLRR